VPRIDSRALTCPGPDFAESDKIYHSHDVAPIIESLKKLNMESLQI
jgi:hypothetical protein